MSKFDFGEAIGFIVWKRWYPAVRHGHHNYATTYDFPVRFKYIENWSLDPTDRTVFERETVVRWNLPVYIKAAKELEAEGVAAITTNCGMTGMIQEELANAVEIPVFTSSLMQIPLVYRSLKRGKKVGILTICARWCKAENYKLLRICGWDESMPIAIAGMVESEYYDKWASMENGEFKRAEEALVAEVKKLISENPDIGALVLECTEMPLFAAAVREATGLPVFDSTTMVRYIYNAVVKKHYF